MSSKPSTMPKPGPATQPVDNDAMKPVKQVEKGIKVIALKPGTYKQCRKDTGDQFMIEKEEQLGSWMECEDPVLQVKHKANVDARKAQLRSMAAKTVAGE